MKFIDKIKKYTLISLALLTLVQCQSLWNNIGTGMAYSLVPLIIFSEESAKLAHISIAYQD